jgi:hypothetical protein
MSLVNNYDVHESDAARDDKRPFNGAIDPERPEIALRSSHRNPMEAAVQSLRSAAAARSREKAANNPERSITELPHPGAAAAAAER